MKVIIYSTVSCPWCHKAKEFMKEHKVKFTNKNVGEDQKAAQEMIKKSGQQGVPVIDVGGEIIVGFDESKLRKLLKIE
ncbi:NrdH-redoxin [Candidatus Pacearchaeota archaeon CG10_big_fil_rev_8_21_14_0_10_35_219]|nr:glutaredoxin family protein [Candidatus Pacearchaeota archaeon]PIO07980.1 MAG: NrdH-redoxin [Candidatus Pacearchaeota archaeon CG10_big_fil_rev_8_21_14_0_10_35_219]PIY81434.1 MAG: NrdH-redoxin [Candidatus Pacearchaeota archaeon CG_4_10_14_0_8_um_filter_35_169]PIZ80602.1 MAG: NrdH-redoxin [Candidatus Pacearchaeota archaeon CG_4_10_14_0_2_um_filter_35_33]PJA70099.1 MAG: NrdH-redoxin [Candidatus Pacearchaeota archaeon CG_4_9_14_3_um_filter_35_19]PJB93825.1 MAG: NrdH-redoxin [Candidatus Pacearc